MKTSRLLFGFSVGLLAMACSLHGHEAAGDTPRQEAALMTGWRFHQGEAIQADAVAFDDTTWQTVTLPHTWNAQDGEDGGGNYYRGVGWYRRHFRVEKSWAGRQIYLQFDGANRSAEVFLNGRRLGAHRGGFARFRFDATAAIMFDGDNVLAVRVNNGANDNMIPVSGDFTMDGGLYRAVGLISVTPLHIDLLDYASPGVFVKETRVLAERADLDVTVKLANDGSEARTAEVRVTISDAAGAPVADGTGTATLAAGERGALRQRIELTHPHLWDGIRDPYLYQVRADVIASGVVRDTVELPLGIRFFRVDPQRGFFLNGRYLDLRGVNRHQDRWNEGWAVSEADEREDFALIREVGATAIRQSHYQQSQLWNDLSDRAGLVTWAELRVRERRERRHLILRERQGTAPRAHPAELSSSLDLLLERGQRDLRARPAGDADRHEQSPDCRARRGGEGRG